METKPDITDLKPENIVLPPKKPRVKQRFTSREQIMAKIDKFTSKARRQREHQRNCYVIAGRFRKMAHESSDPSFLDKAKINETQGDKWGKKADRLEKDVLKVLSAKLAEFNTDTIPGITTDRSVEGL